MLREKELKECELILREWEAKIRVIELIELSNLENGTWIKSKLMFNY